MCNPDYVASHYLLWGFLFRGNEWRELLTPFITCILIGFLAARECIPLVIRLQRDASVGQNVYESGPASHMAKQGTPTMGGIAFPIAALAATAYFELTGAWHATVEVAWLVAAVGAIGFIDDYLSIKRSMALGLRARAKMTLLLIVAAVAAHFMIQGENATDCGYYIFLGGTQWWFGHLVWLPEVWFYVLVIAAIVGSANAVNLTDGVDGLAGSAVLPPLITLSILSGSWLGFAVSAAVVVFLFYNKFPAKVFMGDTGSLALGALLALLAIKAHVLLFLPLLGIVFVAEALSVIIQVCSFKLTGKRVFKMSPLHHHFELSGWSEQRITRTFALVSWLATAVFCAIVYFSNMRVAGGL